MIISILVSPKTLSVISVERGREKLKTNIGKKGLSIVDKGLEKLKTNIGNNQRLSTIDKGKEKLKTNIDKSPVLSTIDRTEHNTQSEIAKDLGWSTGKVAMADKVWKEALFCLKYLLRMLVYQIANSSI